LELAIKVSLKKKKMSFRTVLDKEAITKNLSHSKLIMDNKLLRTLEIPFNRVSQFQINKQVLEREVKDKVKINI
jgi:hypothetical protein